MSRNLHYRNGFLTVHKENKPELLNIVRSLPGLSDTDLESGLLALGFQLNGNRLNFVATQFTDKINTFLELVAKLVDTKYSELRFGFEAETDFGKLRYEVREEVIQPIWYDSEILWLRQDERVEVAWRRYGEEEGFSDEEPEKPRKTGSRCRRSQSGEHIPSAQRQGETPVEVLLTCSACLTLGVSNINHDEIAWKGE